MYGSKELKFHTSVVATRNVMKGEEVPNHEYIKKKSDVISSDTQHRR